DAERSSTSRSVQNRLEWMPAQWIKALILPNRSTHKSTAAAQSRRSAISPCRVVSEGCAFPRRFSSPSASQSKPTTSAPSRSNRVTHAFPIPLAAPVTKTATPSIPFPLMQEMTTSQQIEERLGPKQSKTRMQEDRRLATATRDQLGPDALDRHAPRFHA